MTKLSVNVNKVALLRNSRTINIPDLLQVTRWVLEAGAQGITVHPRPDQRHIRHADTYDIAALLKAWPEVEYNIEGNPFHNLLPFARDLRPTQCTLVPDAADTFTSDHGWDLEADGEQLRPIIAELKSLGIRVSLFMDAGATTWQLARELGADRVELYTEPYAAAHAAGNPGPELARFAAAAAAAQAAGLGVNAGHDLNLQNLIDFCRIPGILEVSIGHALVADALEMGMKPTVRAYLDVLRQSASA